MMIPNAPSKKILEGNGQDVSNLKRNEFEKEKMNYTHQKFLFKCIFQ